MDADIPLLAILIRVAILVVSFVAIGFFSGSETAFLGMDTWAIEGLASLDDRRAKLLRSLSESKEMTISALLVGTNVFTVLASVMGVSIAHLSGLGGTVAMGLVPLAITLLVFMFSELVPKTYAAAKPTETALATAVLLSSALRWLGPVARAALGLPVLFSRLVAPKTLTAPLGTDEAVRAAVDLAGSSGDSSKEDTDVIYGVLDSSDTRLGEIMVPLDKAVTFAPNTSLEEALDVLRRYRLSRIPVLNRATGQVTGIVYMKDVAREVLRVAGPDQSMGRGRVADAATVSEVARKAFVADIGQNVLDLLARMRKNRVHFAVVVHNGKPVGIVTIEDLIEEILGDIPEDSRIQGRGYAGLASGQGEAGDFDAEGGYLAEE